MALYIREAGPADAPCIVFLHGLWLSSLMWQPQIERLSNEYHCLAPDLPEHGKSTDIGILTLENTSRIVANLIREHTPHGRAHVVGLSLGGAIAIQLLRDVPEVVDHMMVSGTVAHLKPEAIIHFADALVKAELPQGVHVPVLVTVGQKEDFMVKRAARELSRTLPAKAVMAPGVGHVWNMEAPDLFTDTVRAWITDQPLPQELVAL